MTLALLIALLAPRDEVTDLIAKLRAASDPGSRYTHANAIERAVKPGHVPLIHKEIDAGPGQIRPHLIRVLGRIGTKEAMAALRACLQKHEFGARAEAACQLKNLDDDSGMKLLPAFLAKVQTEEEKREILYKLYGFYIDGPTAIPALLQFLQTEKNENLRRQAIQVLSSHKDPAAAAALRKIAADAAEPLRYEGLAAVIRTGDEAALEEALRALEGDKVDARSTFTVLGAIENSGQKSVLPRLRALLEKSADSTLRSYLIRSLARMKDEKAVPLLSKLVEDKDVSVSRAAIQALIDLAGKAQVDLLRKVAAEGDSYNRLEAAEALLLLDNPEGYAGIKAELASGRSGYRTQAVLLLGRVRRKESVDLLLPLLDDSDAQTAKYARQSLLQVLPALFPYLNFDDKAPVETIRTWWGKHRPG